MILGDEKKVCIVKLKESVLTKAYRHRFQYVPSWTLATNILTPLYKIPQQKRRINEEVEGGRSELVI